MRHKVGDSVKIKSLDWYNKNKNERGCVDTIDEESLIKEMSKYCGLTAVIKSIVNDRYKIDIDNEEWFWTDDMFEELVEEETKQNNDMEEMLLGWVKESDNLRLVPHKDYEIKHNGDNFYLVKKKKKYPKTYEECCKIIHSDPKFYIDTHLYSGTLETLYKLLICRDAYWKIAGDWKPNWKSDEDGCNMIKFCIKNFEGEIVRAVTSESNTILAFPTEEMRDAFYENFKNEIEQCKELL